jgi:hypothetical protein
MTLGKRQAFSSLCENGMEHEPRRNGVPGLRVSLVSFPPVKLVKGICNTMR